MAYEALKNKKSYINIFMTAKLNVEQIFGVYWRAIACYACST